MPDERKHNSTLSDSSNITPERRRALILSPEIKRDSRQTECPYKIARRGSAAEDECVETEMSKDRKSNNKIHWTQLASNGTSSQLSPKSTKKSNQELTILQKIHRNQVKVVLEDVLLTELGQSLLRCSGHTFQKTNQSESKKLSDQTSTPTLKNKTRTSLTKRGETNSTEPKATSPFHNNTESKSKSLNSSQKLLESSELSSNSRSPRESESPQAALISKESPIQTSSSSFEENEVTLIEGSLQNEEVLSAGCESVISSSSPVETRRRPREKKADSELLSSKKERRESQESPKDAAKHEENHLCSNGELVQEVEGMRGSVLRLSAGTDFQIPVKRCRLDSLSEDQLLNSDLALDTAEIRSFTLESSNFSQDETIVLSSEEEDEGEGREETKNSALNIQPPEGTKDTNVVDESTTVYEQTKSPESNSSITEMSEEESQGIPLPLSSLHMGGVSAKSSGIMMITPYKITFSLKGNSSDSTVKISLSAINVYKYSLWEEHTLWGCDLDKDNEATPTSLLFLWLSDAQAHKLHDDLSVLELGTRPAESSTCLLLCMAEPLSGIESALLCSLLDIVVSNQGSPELYCTCLTQSDSLNLLQSSEETHLLQLLTPKPDEQTSTSAQSQDSDVQLEPTYTLCHRRAQGSYNVFLAATPGAEWTPYKHCGPTRRLIQFPPPPSKGALTVTTEDLECLDSGEFLNDVIIDFYLKYLLVQKAPQASVARSHIFSSFFYKQLTRRDNANEDSTSTPAQVRRHQRVRTWTRHVDIFEKDFLFVPVNQEAHWYLVVICFPGLEDPQYVKRDNSASVQGNGGEDVDESENETQGDHRSNSDEDKSTDDSRIKSSTSLRQPDCTENTCKKDVVLKRPCILIMDSLKLSIHERIFKLLREYLQVEWETKRMGTRDFSAERMVGSHCKVPLQDNSSDCGLYLLQYAESFLQDPVVHFNLPLRLERWFPRQQVRGKRDEIRDLILHLYRFQKGSLGNDAADDRTDYGNVIK